MSESITVITLLLSALGRIDLQAVFDRDPYESRLRALPGTRLVKVLVVYQMNRHRETARADSDPHRTRWVASSTGWDGGA